MKNIINIQEKFPLCYRGSFHNLKVYFLLLKARHFNFIYTFDLQHERQKLRNIFSSLHDIWKVYFQFKKKKKIFLGIVGL